VNKHVLLTTLLAISAVVATFASGPYRGGALVGALASSVTALASILLLQRTARTRKPLQAALVVMAIMFLARIVVVVAATIAVARAGTSVVGFVVAFFALYSAFAAIEVAYVNGLGRSGAAV
jgi:hypothetical protein